MTPMPLPEWRILVHAMWPVRPDPVSLAIPWIRSEKTTLSGWLSKSSWSLALVATWLQRYKGSENPCVWIPDYFCDNSLVPLRQLGVRLHFYPVTVELRPDYKVIRQQAKLVPPDLFLLVHYFGIPSPAAEAREFCKHWDAWLVEDATHVLLPLPGVGEEGDFVLYSPHKLLPLPDGALLLVRSQGASGLGEEGLLKFGPPTSWVSQLSWAHQLFTQTVVPSALIWVVKRALQKIGIRLKPRLQPFDDELLQSRLPKPSMTPFAQRLLLHTLKSLPTTGLWRKHNQLLLDELLRQDQVPWLEPSWREQNGHWIPYMASYCVQDARSAFARLRVKGIPVTTWPDLPPEVRERPQDHSVALALRASRLFLPLHQSLRVRDFAKFFRLRVFNNNIPPVFVRWNVCTREDWQALLKQTHRSNLLQSWSYGECKAKTENWHVHRLLFLSGNRPIALVQVLQRRIAGLFIISRINRGPLFLTDVDPVLEQVCFAWIDQELGGWWRGRVLSWAPECKLGSDYIVKLYKAGFKLLSPKSWSSSVVDLRLNEALLRSKLSGKWRNMLNVAQRRGLEIEEVKNNKEIFEDLLNQCCHMMQERGQLFSKSLYQELVMQLEQEGTPGLLLAIRSEGRLIAATWTVPHGRMATYLLGWSGEEGRKLRAHHLLLWETIRRLKERGFCHFDLGGIDEERTKGITDFKAGIGGEHYSLIGEGWCS